MSMVSWYESVVVNYPFLSTFVKFALLATSGEVIAYKIRMKRWPDRHFGIIPKAFAWGVLGILIMFAFQIFSKGVPQICGPLLPLTDQKQLNLILVAFYISLFMNCLFAPVMMLLHRLVDIKIEAGKGSFLSLLTASPSMNELFNSVDWEKMWGFVFKKTIPFFWIPAHTVTFLLPPEWRILFAAILSVALGIILSFADNREDEEAVNQIQSEA